MNPVNLSGSTSLLTAVNSPASGAAAPPPSPAMKAMQIAIDQSAQSIAELLGELSSGANSGYQLNVYA